MDYWTMEIIIGFAAMPVLLLVIGLEIALDIIEICSNRTNNK